MQKSIQTENFARSQAAPFQAGQMKTHAIILAGGKGTRMAGPTPKVLHRLQGQTFISLVVQSVRQVASAVTIVVGHRAQEVMANLGPEHSYVWQREQLGTGHALRCAIDEMTPEQLKGAGAILVLPGDHPMISAEALGKMIELHYSEQAVATVSSLRVPDFNGDYEIFRNYGRVVRDPSSHIKSIIEAKDANASELAIQEVNVSYYCFDPAWLKENIAHLNTHNQAGEYYLTDLVRLAFDQDRKVASHILSDHIAAMGVNSLENLTVVENCVQQTQQYRMAQT